MNKLFDCLALFSLSSCLFGGVVFADIISQDNFDYAPGTNLLEAGTGGTGWVTGWNSETGDTFIFTGDMALYIGTAPDCTGRGFASPGGTPYDYPIGAVMSLTFVLRQNTIKSEPGMYPYGSVTLYGNTGEGGPEIPAVRVGFGSLDGSLGIVAVTGKVGEAYTYDLITAAVPGTSYDFQYDTFTDTGFQVSVKEEGAAEWDVQRVYPWFNSESIANLASVAIGGTNTYGPTEWYPTELDDITLTGTGADVPEPSTLLLLLPFIGFGLKSLRKKRFMKP
jgi:hypothetical protein